MDNAFTFSEMRQINELIRSLPKSHMTPEQVRTFLENLFSLIFFDKASVYFYKWNDSHFSQIDSIDYNVTSDYVDMSEYYNSYEAYDDIFASINMPVPVSYRFSDYFDFEERMTNPAWREFYIPSNIYYGINANILAKSSNDIHIGLVLYREKSRHDFSLKALEIIRTLQPYLASALDYYGEDRGDVQQYESAVQMTQVGHAVFDKNCRLISSNAAYHHMTDSGEGSSVLVSALDDLCLDIRDNYLHTPGFSTAVMLAEAPYYIEAEVLDSTDSSGPFINILIDDLGYLIDARISSLGNQYALSSKELTVFRQLLKGQSNEQIANELYMSIPSVKKHTASIYSKLGIKSNRQLTGKVLCFDTEDDTAMRHHPEH